MASISQKCHPLSRDTFYNLLQHTQALMKQKRTWWEIIAALSSMKKSVNQWDWLMTAGIHWQHWLAFLEVATLGYVISFIRLQVGGQHFWSRNSISQGTEVNTLHSSYYPCIICHMIIQNDFQGRNLPGQPGRLIIRAARQK